MTSQNNKKILVVEDEKPLSTAISEKLKSGGYDTVTVKSVDEASEVLEKEKIDAVWLDHYLFGNKNGIDLVVKMKEEGSQWKSIPIFVVSNTATGDKVKQYLSFGVQKYFVKAESKLEEIISEIENSLEKLD
ncbi:response regulator [Candidatus Pacebacteria bacterium]|nr:response regulator [Candidatus Paceibacterota bacterium]